MAEQATAAAHEAMGGAAPSAPGVLTRVTEIAMIVNAAAHGLASAGWAFGFGPHAAEQPQMAHRAGAAGFAALVMFVLVARRLRRDAALIALPIAFVVGNLVVSVSEFVASGDASLLGPATFEAVFLSIYSAFAVSRLRSRRVA